MAHLTSISAAALCIALAACQENPAEVRSNADEFPLRSTYTATATPVGTSTVRIKFQGRTSNAGTMRVKAN